MFFSTCGQGGNKNAKERFQRSGWTVYKYFHRVLKAVTKMSLEWIQPFTRHDVHPYIRNNPRYWPYFKVSNVRTRVVVYIEFFSIMCSLILDDLCRIVLGQSTAHIYRLPYVRKIKSGSLKEKEL